MPCGHVDSITVEIKPALVASRLHTVTHTLPHRGHDCTLLAQRSVQQVPSDCSEEKSLQQSYNDVLE